MPSHRRKMYLGYWSTTGISLVDTGRLLTVTGAAECRWPARFVAVMVCSKHWCVWTCRMPSHRRKVDLGYWSITGRFGVWGVLGVRESVTTGFWTSGALSAPLRPTHDQISQFPSQKCEKFPDTKNPIISRPPNPPKPQICQMDQ